MNKKEKLLDIINIVLKGNNRKPRTSINEDDNLWNDIGFDSFDLAELTVIIEEEFDVDVFEDGVIDTVKQILIKIGDK